MFQWHFNDIIMILELCLTDILKHFHRNTNMHLYSSLNDLKEIIDYLIYHIHWNHLECGIYNIRVIFELVQPPPLSVTDFQQCQAYLFYMCFHTILDNLWYRLPLNDMFEETLIWSIIVYRVCLSTSLLFVILNLGELPCNSAHRIENTRKVPWLKWICAYSHKSMPC